MSIGTIRIPLNALQKVVYDRLSLAISPVKVFSFVPQNEDFPHAVLGTQRTVANWTKTSWAADVTYEINLWSQSESTVEINDLVNKVVNAFQADLPIGDGFGIVHQVLESVDSFPEFYEEGGLQHAQVRYSWTVVDQRAHQ